MKISFLCCFCLTFIFNSLYAQNELADSINSDSIYRIVFEKFFVDKGLKSNGEVLLIEYNYLTTSLLPDSINGIKLDFVELNKKLFKIKGRSLNVFRIVPLRIKAGKFLVSVIEYKAVFEKKKIHLVNIGGEEYYFRYNCETTRLMPLDSDQF